MFKKIQIFTLQNLTVVDEKWPLVSTTSSSVPLDPVVGWDLGSSNEKKTDQSSYQWEFQDPKLEVPTIYKAYFLGLNFREYPEIPIDHRTIQFVTPGPNYQPPMVLGNADLGMADLLLEKY